MGCLCSKCISSETDVNANGTHSPVPQCDAQLFLPPNSGNSIQLQASITSQSNNSKKSSKLKPAYAVIINCKEFKDDPKSTRIGTEKDCEALKKVFTKFKLEIEMFNNPTLKEIDSIVAMVKKKNFTEYSAVLFVILSHGDRNDMIAAYDGKYELYDKIINPIADNQTLSSKPKIFFLQACKGEKELLIRTDKTTSENPMGTFIFFSSFEGFVSIRYPSTGSIFIQTLCKHLDKDGETKDLYTIALAVIDDINNQPHIQYHTQTPTIKTALTTKYVFGDYI